MPASTRPVPASTSSLLQMLRQDRIFDRAEEGGVNAHREQGGEHERDGVEEQPRRSEDHDGDLGGLDEADDPRLVASVRQLPGKRREQEEGQDEKRARDGVERRLLGRVGIDGVGDQDHHRRLEQIVVEGAQELGDEQRQEAPLRQEMDRILHGAQARAAWVRRNMRRRVIAASRRRSNSPVIPATHPVIPAQAGIQRAAAQRGGRAGFPLSRE